MRRPARLIYNYLSASSPPINIALPWQPSSTDGLFKMNIDAADAELDNLKFWAQTNWGEIPYKFRYGLDVRRHLFEQKPQIKQLILTNAKSQLSKYFAHLKILDMKIYTDEDDSNLTPNQIRFYLLAETPKGKQVELNQTLGINN